MRAAENRAVIELASAVNHARAARGRVERERARIGLDRDRAIDLAEALDALVDLAEGLSRALVHHWRHVSNPIGGVTGLFRAFRSLASEEDVLDAALFGGADTPVRPRHGAPLADLVAGAAAHAAAGARIVSGRRYRQRDPHALALHLYATGTRVTAIAARELPALSLRRAHLEPRPAAEACDIAHSLLHAVCLDLRDESARDVARFDALHRLMWTDLVAAGLQRDDARSGGVPGLCDGVPRPERGVVGSVRALLARAGHDPVLTALLRDEPGVAPIP